jgi:hypothetical protein
MQAFEESATGTGTNILKVRMLCQGRALGKVAQEGVKEGRANVSVVGGAERVQAAREGEVSAAASSSNTRFVFGLLLWSSEFISQ